MSHVEIFLDKWCLPIVQVSLRGRVFSRPLEPLVAFPLLKPYQLDFFDRITKQQPPTITIFYCGVVILVVPKLGAS